MTMKRCEDCPGRGANPDVTGEVVRCYSEVFQVDRIAADNCWKAAESEGQTSFSDPNANVRAIPGAISRGPKNGGTSSRPRPMME